jgi:hypothetical protein
MGEAVWTVETLRDRSGKQPIAIGSCRVARRLGSMQSRRGLSLGSRVSGFRRRRARELDASTCEVASSEKCQREVMHHISSNRKKLISAWLA